MVQTDKYLILLFLFLVQETEPNSMLSYNAGHMFWREQRIGSKKTGSEMKQTISLLKHILARFFMSSCNLFPVANRSPLSCLHAFFCLILLLHYTHAINLCAVWCVAWHACSRSHVIGSWNGMTESNFADDSPSRDHYQSSLSKSARSCWHHFCDERNEHTSISCFILFHFLSSWSLISFFFSSSIFRVYSSFSPRSHRDRTKQKEGKTGTRLRGCCSVTRLHDFPW